VFTVIQELLTTHTAGKIIVYSSSVDRVRRIAELLDCEAYFRAITDKADMFARIIGPACRVVVATNALSLGINIPNIRAVVYMDPVTKLRDFGQDSGRAGRDGALSESIIISAPLPYRSGAVTEVSIMTRSNIERPLAAFDSGQSCIRVILDGHLDGRENRQRCEDGEEQCWVCRGGDISVVQSGEEEQEMAVSRDIADDANADERQDQVEFEAVSSQRRQVREHMQSTQRSAASEVNTFRR
jgi:superfamily II DNA helicase RecQ